MVWRGEIIEIEENVDAISYLEEQWKYCGVMKPEFVCPGVEHDHL